MAIDPNRIECSDCGIAIEQAAVAVEPRLPCPTCGSARRSHFVTIAETLVARDGLGIKAKRRGQKKPYVEALSFPSHSRRLAKPVHHERLIDRDKDLYHEKVTDYETGAIIHEQSEPLSEHIGHGSDKRRLNKADASQETPRK